MDAGPIMQNGMGAMALTSTEIINYCRGSGNELTPWEFKLIRRVSADYLSQLQKSGEQFCSAPFKTGGAKSKEARAELDKKLRAAFK